MQKRRLVTAAQVRKRYGDKSQMTLWRWLRDPDLSFPEPIYIRRLRYWDEAELDAFDDRQRDRAA